MRGIEFHNREKETKEIRAILDRRPTLITFVYGPINSGKTELITHTIEELPDEYVVFYINLRTKFLSSYDDFIESLFEMEIATEGANRKRKETLAELVSSVTKVAGIPINKEFLDYVFKDNKPKNAFSHLIKLFEEVKESGKHPVLILDELQKIGDVKVNGSPIYELFWFCRFLWSIAVARPRVAAIAGATPSSLRLYDFALNQRNAKTRGRKGAKVGNHRIHQNQEVYSEATLKDRCRHLLVDDSDEETTMAFPEVNGLSEGGKELVWHHCGGEPIGFSDGGSYAYEMITPEIVYPVKENILFVDSVRGIIKPQSRLNLLALEVITNA